MMRMLIATTVLLLTGSFGFAEEKAKKPALTGTWTKKAGDFDLKFVFGKNEVVTFSMLNGDDGCELDAKYTIDKDGALKCVVTRFEKKGNFPVEKEKGYKFAFKIAIKDKKATITDFTGDDIQEEQKNTLEGEYSAGK